MAGVIIAEMQAYFDNDDRLVKPEGLDMPLFSGGDTPAAALDNTQVAGENAPLDLERILAITAGYTLAAFGHRDLRPALDLLLAHAENPHLQLPVKQRASTSLISTDDRVQACCPSLCLICPS